MTRIEEFNSKNKNKINYSEVSSLTKQIPHEAEHDLPSPSTQIKSEISLCLENENINDLDCESYASENNEYVPLGDINAKPLSQGKLNDLVRDLDLPKEAAELLGSRLQEDHLLAPDTTFSWYRNVA